MSAAQHEPPGAGRPRGGAHTFVLLSGDVALADPRVVPAFYRAAAALGVR